MNRACGYVIANDGVRLRYDEAGVGKAVVLIHGGGLSNVWWERNLPAFSGRFHVIAPDTRGCGRSQRTPWGHRTARYAADVREIIHALGLHDVTLVGWSIGARTCYSYLELFGAHRLRGVVLVDETVHVSVHRPPPPGSERQPGESDGDYRRRKMRALLGPVYGPQATGPEIDRLANSASDYAPAGQTTTRRTGARSARRSGFRCWWPPAGTAAHSPAAATRPITSPAPAWRYSSTAITRRSTRRRSGSTASSPIS